MGRDLPKVSQELKGQEREGVLSPPTYLYSSLLYVGGELASEQESTSLQPDRTRVSRNLPAE